jgi:hypothetical protein
MSNGARWFGTFAVVSFVGVIGFLGYRSTEDEQQARAAEQATLHRQEAERRERRKPPAPSLPLAQDQMRRAMASEARDDYVAARISFDDYSPSGITMVYQLPAGDPPAPIVAEFEVRRCATSAVKALIAAGWNPRERETFITCRGRQAAPKSITGGEMVRRLGRATYSWYEDRVEFEADE